MLRAAMPFQRETAWVRPVAAPPVGSLSPMQRLVGLLAFSGLVLGAVIAAREDECAERRAAGARHATASSLSTLAPIMRTGPATPLDAACRAQVGRSEKLKPTP